MSFVIGTAGHVDHGKSTLIRALTGIDPDRLAEEKRRGMTIDLGFAYLTLPSGQLVGIVDVPGHARFIHNMLAGVHGLDAVLLVVAADEGVMPQTVEHLEIAHLLGVRQGVVALTKVDLVDADWLPMVETEVREALVGTSLEGAALVRLSVPNGIGTGELMTRLDAALAGAEHRPDLGRPRLPVDRAFTISGFGTVVTGTLIEGGLHLNQELELVPAGKPVRVRGLQQHGRSVEAAEPGSRVAANLVGLSRSDVNRGQVLVQPGWLDPTRRLDASISVLRNAGPLRHGSEVTVYCGTSEVSGRVSVLGAAELGPGAQGFIQLLLRDALPALIGDRFVLRRPSPSQTIGGGVILDVSPLRHARHESATLQALGRRQQGAYLEEELRKHTHGVTEAALLRSALADHSALSGVAARRAGEWLFSVDAWTALAGCVQQELTRYHAAHPLLRGMPREELMSRLRVAPGAFAAFLKELVQEGLVTEHQGTVALTAHRAQVPANGEAARLVEALSLDPQVPPSLSEAMRQSGATQEIVRSLVQSGELVKVSDDLAFTRAGYEAAVSLVREIVERDGSITVAQLRDRLHASRRPVLALLEHLDAKKMTRRVGDARVLR